MCYNDYGDNMSRKQKNMIYYILLGVILSLIIFILPISNDYSFIPLFILFTLYLVLNYFNDINYRYERELYIFWCSVMITYNIFCFSIISIILSILLFILLLFQFHCMNKKKNSKKEEIVTDIKKEEKVEIKKEQVSDDIEYDIDALKDEFSKLYINMQNYFVEFNYDELNKILSNKLFEIYKKQMNKNESSGRMIGKENIIINNIEIIDFINDDNSSKYIVKIDVSEDKYSSSDKSNSCTYKSVYELTIIKEKYYYIDDLKLLYSKIKKS